MTEQMVAKREWITVDLDGETPIGESETAREWCVDVDTHGYTNDFFRVRACDAEGKLLTEKAVDNDLIVRVYITGHGLRLFGTGKVKYSFPWVLVEGKG